MFFKNPRVLYGQQKWKEAKYQPLSVDEDVQSPSQPALASAWARYIRFAIFPVLLTWTIFLVYLTVHLHMLYSLRTGENELAQWTPLRDKITYERWKFNAGLHGERTKFMGESNETNEAWEELIRHGIILLDSKDAARLPVKTALWNEGHGHYVVGVEMWHQLHCLNVLRKGLWSSTPTALSASGPWSPNPTSAHMQHVDHCVDYLRQTILCHGDVGLIPFADDHGEYIPLFNITKTCRAYKPLEEWVDEHQAGDATPEDGAGVAHMV